jgi:phosphatidylinositol glycan class B
LAIAACSCIIRPTSALLWIFLGLQLLASYPHRCFQILYDVTVTGYAPNLIRIFAIIFSIYIDRFFYKKWFLIPWEFWKVNVLENISEFYGSHPFHWYFTQAIPLVLFTFLPFSILGTADVLHTRKSNLFWACILVVLTLSYQKHKEFRFLMPLVAPMMIYAGRGLDRIAKADIDKNRSGPKSHLLRYLTMLAITNFIIGFYFSRVHKRGIIDVTNWIRKEAYAGNITSVLYLMPCHSTPFYSHIHIDIPMRFITCEPPLG